MAACEFIETCVFFNDKMAEIPATAKLMKNVYCKEHFEDCARYIVYRTLGRDKIPPEMYPSEVEAAKQLIAATNGSR